MSVLVRTLDQKKWLALYKKKNDKKQYLDISADQTKL